MPDNEEILRKFRIGYYTFSQIKKVYGLNDQEAMAAIKPALDDGSYANFDPRLTPQENIAKWQSRTEDNA